MQNHILVNLDKKEVVLPHGLGLLSTQYAHTGDEGSLSDAMYLLMASSSGEGHGDFPHVEGVSGAWSGDRVAVVGEYTMKDSISGEPYADTLYQRASETYKDISGDVRRAFEKVFSISYVESHIGTWPTYTRVI